MTGAELVRLHGAHVPQHGAKRHLDFTVNLDRFDSSVNRPAHELVNAREPLEIMQLAVGVGRVRQPRRTTDCVVRGGDEHEVRVATASDNDRRRRRDCQVRNGDACFLTQLSSGRLQRRFVTLAFATEVVPPLVRLGPTEKTAQLGDDQHACTVEACERRNWSAKRRVTGSYGVCSGMSLVPSSIGATSASEPPAGGDGHGMTGFPSSSSSWSMNTPSSWS